MTTIIHAEVIQRNTGDGNYGFAGLVYVENGINALKEGPAYLMDFTGQPPVIYTDEICGEPEGYCSQSIDGLLNQPIWHSTNKEGFSLVRVIPTGLDDGGFIIYGANSEPLIRDPGENLMIKYRGGRVVTYTPSDSSVRGMKLGQVIKLSGAFHNPENEKLYLANLTTPAQSVMQQIQQKRVDVALKKMSAEEYRAWLLEDDNRRPLGCVADTDPEFLYFIKELVSNGHFEAGIGTMTESERVDFERRSKNAMRKVLQAKTRDLSLDIN